MTAVPREPAFDAMMAGFVRAVDEAAGRPICAECETRFYGPPVTDVNERFWIPRLARAWCSTDCREATAEREAVPA